jgi:hypothetical protein
LVAVSARISGGIIAFTEPEEKQEKMIFTALVA